MVKSRPSPRRSAEVKATARALNQLSSRLKTATESRIRLVAAAGHGLRTPITRMRLRAEFLAKEIIERYGGTVTLENRQGGGLARTVVFAAV